MMYYTSSGQVDNQLDCKQPKPHCSKVTQVVDFVETEVDCCTAQVRTVDLMNDLTLILMVKVPIITPE